MLNLNFAKTKKVKAERRRKDKDIAKTKSKTNETNCNLLSRHQSSLEEKQQSNGRGERNYVRVYDKDKPPKRILG